MGLIVVGGLGGFFTFPEKYQRIVNSINIKGNAHLEAVSRTLEDSLDYVQEYFSIIMLKSIELVDDDGVSEQDRTPVQKNNGVKEKAKQIALQVSSALKHVGVLAVELFLTEEGNIFVNEVAPRTHNSGHHTIETSITDQFEQHVRAVLSLPLGNTDLIVAGVMVNLVGAEGHTGQVHYNNIEKALSMKGVIPHIYGKKQTRPFRKMGHVTIVDRDINSARETAEKVKQLITVISK